MSDSYDGTPEETADSEQKPVFLTKNACGANARNRYLILKNVRCDKNRDAFLAYFAIYETEFLN